MKINRLCVMAIVMMMSLCVCSPVYASVLDEFGNEIDWDTDGAGNEDVAGDEGDYVPINADLLDSERLEQSEGEAESIADVINQNRVSDDDIGNGTVTLKFEAPDEWRGSNVVVSLYNKDLWQSYEVYIYKQNDFIEQEELPCGEYEIRGAAVVGDMNGVYPLMIDANGRQGFQLEQGGGKIVINVELAGSNNYVKETETEHEETEHEKEESEVKQESALEKTAKGFLWDNMIFVIMLVIGLAGFALYRKRSDKDED